MGAWQGGGQERDGGRWEVEWGEGGPRATRRWQVPGRRGGGRGRRHTTLPQLPRHGHDPAVCTLTIPYNLLAISSRAQVLEELEEAVALLVEELAALLKAHGKACKEQVPAETRQTAGRVYNLVMKQPELGLAVKGYNELVVVLQYALMGKEGI